MKSKILFSSFALALGALTFSSCADQLDQEQKGVVGIETFYKTDADAEQALAAAYQEFMQNVVGRQPDASGPGIYTPNRICMNMCGDDVLYASGSYNDHEFSGDLNEFRMDPSAEAITFQYKGLYLSVYACNLLLHYFSNPATDFQKRCVAEARVLRAYDYFLLTAMWGNPPLVTDLLAADAKPSKYEGTPEQLFEWVADECKKAYGDLVERADQNDKEMSVRVSRGFAQALAGKALLFAGKYADAKTELEKVINSQKYDLVSGEEWADNFHIEGDCNKEKVFEVNFEYNAGKTGWGGMIQRSSWMEAEAWNWRAGNFAANPLKNYCGGLDGWGGLGVPQAFGDEFYANDGHSKRFDATLIHIDDAICLPYYADDAINQMTKEEKMASTKVGIQDINEGLYGNSTWLAFKQIMRGSDTEGQKYGADIRLNNYLIMRYAEVLLNYAECCIKTNDAPKALPILQRIQNRAGSAHVSTKADMKELMNEKHYELWLEGCRWFDLMRWLRSGDLTYDSAPIKTLMNAGSDVPHLYDKLFRAPQARDKKVTWEHGTEANSRFYTVSTSAAKNNGVEVGFKKGKHEYFPFPLTVTDNNPNIKNGSAWN